MYSMILMRKSVSKLKLKVNAQNEGNYFLTFRHGACKISLVCYTLTRIPSQGFVFTGIWPGTAFIATWRFDADRHGLSSGLLQNFTWALTHTPGRNF